MVAQKPTINTANKTQLRAFQQGADYVIAPVLGRPAVWSVRKQGQTAPYLVNVELSTCSCPCRQAVCKHMEMVRLKMALLQSRPAPAPVVLSREERMRRDFGPDCF
jgi:hypothetical protein